MAGTPVGAGPKVTQAAGSVFVLRPLPYARARSSRSSRRRRFGFITINTTRDMSTPKPARRRHALRWSVAQATRSCHRAETEHAPIVNNADRRGTTRSIDAVWVPEAAASRRSPSKCELTWHLAAPKRSKEELGTAATTLFGSGRQGRLVLDGAKLRVVNTGNAENPLTAYTKPLLAIDLARTTWNVQSRSSSTGS